MCFLSSSPPLRHTLTGCGTTGSQGAVVMYDVKSDESFAGVEVWIKELRENVQGPLVIAIVGNKSDAEPELRMVPTERGKAFALEQDCLFFETSAKNDTGIVELFQEMCQKIVEAHIKQAVRDPQPAPQDGKIFVSQGTGGSAGAQKQSCGC